MRVSFEWLKELVDFSFSPEEASHRLTMAGLEIEGVEPFGSDSVFEVNVTPNRGDCLSVIGLARELSAIANNPVKLPSFEVDESPDPLFAVEIDDPNLCRRYAGRVIKGVTIAPSPDWIKSRLEKSGIRSINNVVDVTNYALLQFGHPLHAFDLNCLKGGKIVVKTAEKGSSIKTLDGIERKLAVKNLLIWDGERPVAIAGVMGGLDTEVTASTKDIFLESAWFDPSSIRKSSKMLGLGSEASFRFERGTDIIMLETALDYAAYLIQKVAGGTIHKKIDNYPLPFEPQTIEVSTEKVNRLIGTEIAQGEMVDIMKRLGFGVSAGVGKFSVTVPSHRPDINRDFDIVEEVARIYGFEKIPASAPKATVSVEGINVGRLMKKRIGEFVRLAGFNEAVNMSFMNALHLDVLNIFDTDARRRHVAIINPLRQEEAVMRTTLLPSLIENLTLNFSRGVRDVRIFEMSRVFDSSTKPQPIEKERIAAILYRENSPTLWKESADAFYVIKGVIQGLLDELGIKVFDFVAGEEPFLHIGKSADLMIGTHKIGYLGILSPFVTEKLEVKLKGDIAVFELDLQSLLNAVAEKITYHPIPRFPYVERDLAILVDEAVTSLEIIELIKEHPSEIVEDVWVFDSYKGANIPVGKKSLAFGVRYRAKDRTLKDDEVESAQKEIIYLLSAKTGGTLRA